MGEKFYYSRTVLVDMDGVLADFDGAILERLPKEVARVARTSFYMHHDYPEHEDLIYEITGDQRFFHDLPVIDGALEGWQRLVDLGYDPRICSAPLSHNGTTREGKLDWLKRHMVPEFGKHVVERAIIDPRKYNYPGFALIDDRPHVETRGIAKWRHVVFDQPYNQESTAQYRLHGWHDENLGNVLEQVRLAA